jgi:L-alanine-DL-glutamate epimerase-like enolase superfamily enzyme
VAAGEYGYDQTYFRRMLAAGAVDVLQADATRCAGPTGFLHVAALADAFHIPLSSHCAPSLHVPFAAALANVRHMEYFHDHVRIEHLLFDGTPEAHDGRLAPDLDRPGLGLDLRRSDAEAWRCR